MRIMRTLQTDTRKTGIQTMREVQLLSSGNVGSEMGTLPNRKMVMNIKDFYIIIIIV